MIRKIKDGEKFNSDPHEKTVACFDMERELGLLQSEVGAFHCKRKYPVYNFTIHNILTTEGFRYIWHAVIAQRGANVIANWQWMLFNHETSNGTNTINISLFW